ncbi:MAG: hypothetical protein P4M05_28245 [Bradyrhizobium sp.]|nr:hypothetical protein [Bradyrhizobium sp.]
MTQTTPERADKIRAAWERKREHALQLLLTGKQLFVDALIRHDAPVQWYPAPETPELTITVERITFIIEVGMPPDHWRIRCEDVVLEHGRMPELRSVVS